MSGGQTLGKVIFQMKIVSRKKNPRELNFKEAFMRSIGYTFCYAAHFIPFLISYLRQNHRGIPDMLSQTESMTQEEYQSFLKEKDKESGSLLPFPKRTLLISEKSQLDLFKRHG